MNPNLKAFQQQTIVEQLIKVLADNRVTYQDAPQVLNSVRVELDDLCKQQTIQAPSN